MKRVQKAASRLSRTPAESAALRGDAAIRAKVALFAVVAAAALVIYGPLMTARFARWLRFAPSVPIESQAWHILAAPKGAPCPNDATGDRACPASPASPALWRSPLTREPRDTELTDVPRGARPAEYWIGTMISARQLREAYRGRANRLLIGWVDLPFRVWVDGRLIAGGPGWEDTEPTVLALPLARLTDGHPLHVAIHVQGIGEWPNSPDIFNSEFGGEGFVTDEQENDFRAFSTFVWRERSFSLLAAFSVIAALFLFFWLAAPIRQEYFYLALFALFSAFYQAHDVDLFHYALSGQGALALEQLLGYYAAAFAFFLGLSFARGRLALFRYGVPLALALPLPLLARALGGGLPAETSDLIDAVWSRWLAPGFYGAGGLACLIEAWLLHSRREHGTYLAVRIRRLVVFGATMAALGVFYFLVYRNYFPAVVRVFYAVRGFENVLIMLFLAGIALREYGEQERLLAKTPVSRFHQRPVLPDRIAGALLVVDLKNSEWLFRQGAREGDSGKFVDMCVSHLWNAVIRHGGTVLMTDGDGLHAFFDDESSDDPAESALAAVDDMKAGLAVVEHQFRARHLLDGGHGGLRFRGGIALGEIKPVWHEIGRERLAGWTEAGRTNPFVESARLMELERQIAEAKGRCCVVTLEELSRELPRRHWLLHDLALQAKHKNVYRVAAYAPPGDDQGESQAIDIPAA